MKRAYMVIVLMVFSLALLAQSANDRRGFQGKVSSSAKESVRPDGKDETAVKTDIQFTGRTIVIESDVYEIVKKTFDGKSKTTFTCSKRRGTFEITFIAGESISIVDTSNKDTKTVYKSLVEK